MPRNGGVNLSDLVVRRAVHDKGGSVLVASKNAQGRTYTVTIEVSGLFPDGLDPRPDDNIDMSIGFDQRMKA